MLKIFYSLFIFLMLVAIIWLNALDSTRAYNDAITRGEDLRTDLKKFFEIHSIYPEQLSELQSSRLPGRRWYGKTIINYNRNAQGYVMSFGDKFTLWQATEKEDFFPKK